MNSFSISINGHKKESNDKKSKLNSSEIEPDNSKIYSRKYYKKIINSPTVPKI
jgi:hypothetical protein